MSEKNEVEAIIAHAKDPKVEYVHGVPHLLLPPNWESHCLEHLLPAPLKVIESPVFNDATSFCRYYEVFANPDGGTRIFANDEKGTLVAVFDGSEPSAPGHGFHRATLQMALSPEWTVWKAKDGSLLERAQFTRFLEKNLAYIDADAEDGMNGAQLLAMCRDLRVKATGDTHIEEDFASGKRGLRFRLDHEVGRNAPDGSIVPFPESVKVSLRVFKNALRHDFVARLRWTPNKDKGVLFTIDLPEVTTVEDDAFGEVVTQVQMNLGIEVLRGVYFGGSRHER